MMTARIQPAAGRALALILVLCLLSPLAYSTDTTVAQCDVAEATLSAGRDSDLVICGDQLPAEIALAGLEQLGIEQLYQMPLAQCTWNDQRPGFHLVLKASAAADAIRIPVLDADTGASVCELVTDILPPQPEPDPAWLGVGSMPESAVKTVDVRGINTRYFEAGTGPPLVLVHGGQSGGYNNHARKWEAVFPRFAEHFRVIALDRLGQGGTDQLPEEDYADYYALDPVHLLNFIEALGLEDVTLVGHSQGGWPVMRVALDRPELVSCLVNYGSVLVEDDDQLMREALAFVRYVDSTVHPESGPTFYSARRALALRMASGTNVTAAAAQRVLDQYEDARIRALHEVRNTIQLHPYHPSFIALKEQVYEDIAAGKLTVRSMSLWGDQDVQSPFGLGLKFHQMLVDHGVEDQLAVVAGAGHSPHTEFPDVFTRIVTDYCGADAD